MIAHYLKIALRNILKDRIYSGINLIGLSVAVVCCFLLIFWVKFELSFEDCHPKADRIYKVLEVEKRTDGLSKTDWIRPGIAQQLKATFPEIETSIVVAHEQLTFVYEDNENGILVDYTTTTPDYLDLFAYEYIEGSKDNVLNSNGVVMSEETARKFFGNESAIGKSVSFGRMLVCTVQAVVRMPRNTHLKFGILSVHRQSGDYGVHYILIKANTRFSAEAQQRMANFPGTIRETGNKLSFLPIKDVHLHSPKEISNNSSWQTFGDLSQIYLFSFAALLILAIAVINYVNTSTARALSRMREVGVRKVTGSTQRQLIVRFLSETLIISAVSIALALIISKLLFPSFGTIMGDQADFLIDIQTGLIALTVCLLITIFSGGYAAFYLSSADAIVVLHGGFRPGSKEGLRKALIRLQFFLSIGMLISTLVIYKQIHYLFTADTGVDRKNIIILDTSLWYGVEDFIQVIKRENPHIIDATIAMGPPYNLGYSYSGISWEGSTDAVKEIEFVQVTCDHHYAATFGLQVIAGEFIQPGWGWWQFADENSHDIVINQAFQKVMGMDNPIGTTVTYGWRQQGKIIGVVKDFNFKPLKEPITPLIISYNPEMCFKVFIKTTGNNKKETLDFILKKYREIGYPVLQTGRPVMYSTVEEDYNAMYSSEIRTMKILMVFSIISLCLSVMGIFGMVTFMIEKRTKEIAIRRINGAETKDIIALFIANFLQIIGFACAVAIPVSYFVLLQWIQTYAYRTSLSWWIFVIVPLCVSLITAALIAIQVSLATRQNPAEVIKSE